MVVARRVQLAAAITSCARLGTAFMPTGVAASTLMLAVASRPGGWDAMAGDHHRRDFRCCEGFRMTADRDDAACTGAVVRKPPMKMLWGGRRRGYCNRRR
jgi:hypothetical protein